MELRTRVVDFVEEGNTHCARTVHFRVSIKCVNDKVRLEHETGSLHGKPQGCRGHGKLAGVHDCLRAQIERKPDVTLDELVCALRRDPEGLTFNVRPCGEFSAGLECHTGKDLRASEQKRPDVTRYREVCKARRQPFMLDHLERLVFVDDTSLKTNMTKTTGWAPEGTRLIDHAPAGHWNTHTLHRGLNGMTGSMQPVSSAGRWTKTCSTSTSRASRLRHYGHVILSSSTNCPPTRVLSLPAS